jgi:hypothetical protein
MRFMLQVRANHKSEAGVMPSRELIESMGKFNQEMIQAGIMLAGEGLQPSSKGARIAFSNAGPKVVEPPFAEPNELIAGFWIIEVKSRQEAIDWARRAPFEPGDVVEIRQIFEASDFPPEILPPEESAREQSWRDAQQQKSSPR